MSLADDPWTTGQRRTADAADWLAIDRVDVDIGQDPGSP
jgi:hypothetical protein